MPINPVVILILLGLLAVILIATLGAAASRLFKFRYSRLALLSFLVYTAVGYAIGCKANATAAMVASAAIGLFDATVGWQLCLRFRAHMSEEELQVVLEMPVAVRVLMTVIIAVACGGVGAVVASC